MYLFMKNEMVCHEIQNDVNLQIEFIGIISPCRCCHLQNLNFFTFFFLNSKYNLMISSFNPDKSLAFIYSLVHYDNTKEWIGKSS